MFSSIIIIRFLELATFHKEFKSNSTSYFCWIWPNFVESKIIRLHVYPPPDYSILMTAFHVQDEGGWEWGTRNYHSVVTQLSAIFEYLFLFEWMSVNICCLSQSNILSWQFRAGLLCRDLCIQTSHGSLIESSRYGHLELKATFKRK